MRTDFFVPEEHAEDFTVTKNPKVITEQFTPLETRLAQEKPALMPGLLLLEQELGLKDFQRLISPLHNLTVAKGHCLIIAPSALHRTALEREALPALARAFQVQQIRIVIQD